MNPKNLLDLHIHTDNSFDGNHSAIFLCETAVSRGLRAVALTDHLEMDHFFDQNFDRTAMQSYFEIVKARSAFRGTLVVLAGVELGDPTYDIPQSEALLRQYDYDFVIGSIHNLRNTADFWFLRYDEITDDEIRTLLEQYFEEVLALARWGKFDALAHLTYPLRYICGEHGRKVDLHVYAQQIDAILETAAKNQLALEINTSGLRQKIGVTMPNLDIVRRFRALGGKRVTIGSDAHFAKDLGAGIAEGMEIALRAGFSHVSLYQNREPIEILIA
ncbi:MAG: histidinol-phosphatase HisJ family protein [Oscillospiraceae bacterium]|jgi:histidinol-phosphatase (PHP family)|nr:histidinol-phosphatase HisJ family protein [Oscillospiraceae bacterium]